MSTKSTRQELKAGIEGSVLRAEELTLSLEGLRLQLKSPPHIVIKSGSKGS